MRRSQWAPRPAYIPRSVSVVRGCIQIRPMGETHNGAGHGALPFNGDLLIWTADIGARAGSHRRCNLVMDWTGQGALQTAFRDMRQIIEFKSDMADTASTFIIDQLITTEKYTIERKITTDPLI